MSAPESKNGTAQRPDQSLNETEASSFAAGWFVNTGSRDRSPGSPEFRLPEHMIPGDRRRSTVTSTVS